MRAGRTVTVYVPTLAEWSLGMICLSVAFAITSHGGVLGHGRPNCVSARVVHDGLVAGCLSLNGAGVVFVGAEVDSGYWSPAASWTERADGHWCGFAVPPFGGLHQPGGINLHVSTRAASWECSYVVTALIWIAVWLMARRGACFGVKQSLVATSVVAVVFAMIGAGVALPLVLLLHLSTATLLVAVAIRLARYALAQMNLPWPLGVNGQDGGAAPPSSNREPPDRPQPPPPNDAAPPSSRLPESVQVD
ncbi:hypothetical protein KOR34_12430 [Posidoniimonas corsicana]|uniref:Uncharacterized protein n=1 Tax=Posidoniimonas corsicana TaxID=1938618 RepID=A0A5C5VCM3_9BACT|nr:hypothetical protein [Posidoniimonas corsicana]TWT36338.1 hypothetical protein KOR34_12430 [Posidoniimonas corsicana]